MAASRTDRVGFQLVACVLLFVAFLAVHPSSGRAAVGDWTAHVNSSSLFFVFTQENYVWSASSGGAVGFNPATEEFTKILRTQPGTLVSNDLSCVAVTQGGLKWFGTKGYGLSLLDGGEWTLFTAGITNLPSNQINTLVPLGTSLWVGTTQGLALVEGSSIVRTYNPSNTGGGIPSYNINDLVATDDTVWCATSGGVSRGVKTGSTWIWTPVNTGLTNLLVLSVAFFENSLWVAAADGTYEYQAGAWVKRGSVPYLLVLDLKQAGTEFYAAAGDSGVLVWQTDNWQRATPTGFGGRFRHLASDNSGHLWCATTTGLVLYDGSQWRRLLPPGPAYNYTEDVSVSPDGVIWTATRANSASLKYDEGVWSVYDYSTSDGNFQLAWMFSVFTPDPQTVWFGHCCCTTCRVDRLVVIDGSETWSNFPFINSKDITVDAAGIVWFSSYGYGIYRYDPSDGSYSNLQASVGGLSSNEVEAVAPLDTGRRWVGHMLAGMDYWDDKGTVQTADDTWKHLTTSEGLASMSVTSAVVSGNKTYIGTLAGISVFEDTVWSRNYSGSDLSPASSQVNDVALDRFGNMWVATSAGAAVIDASGNLTVYEYETSGLVDDQVFCVAVDDSRGEVWFGTGKGMSVLKAWGPPAGRILDDAFVYPNPLKPGDSGVFRVAGLPSEARAWVFDLGGRQLRSLGTINNGDVLWDGTDSGGVPVPTGLYLIRLETENSASVKKVAVIR